MTKFGPKYAFLVISSHGDQKTKRTRFPGGISIKWVPRLLLSPVKIRIFCPKTTKVGPKLALLVILYAVGGLVGGCGSWAVTGKTPIYFMYLIFCR